MTTLTFGEIIVVVNLADLYKEFTAECFTEGEDPCWNMAKAVDFFARYNLPMSTKEKDLAIVYSYKTLLSGKVDLVKGDHVIITGDPVIGNHALVADAGHSVFIIKALEDVHFDPDIVLNAGNANSLRVALLPYIDNGMIEFIDKVSARVYTTYQSIPSTEERVNEV